MTLIQTKEKNAVNSFEKEFFKLMNNSIYGKTMKNFLKRVKARLFNNAKDHKKYVSKPSFISQKIFSKNFVAIHKIKPVLTLDKLIYVGFSILDLSKYLMYKFYYKYMKRKYNANLLFTLGYRINVHVQLFFFVQISPLHDPCQVLYDYFF